MGSLSLLQRIFPTQESNRGLLHCRWSLYQLSYQGSWTRVPPLYPGQENTKPDIRTKGLAERGLECFIWSCRDSTLGEEDLGFQVLYWKQPALLYFTDCGLLESPMNGIKYDLFSMMLFGWEQLGFVAPGSSAVKTPHLIENIICLEGLGSSPCLWERSVWGFTCAQRHHQGNLGHAWFPQRVSSWEEACRDQCVLSPSSQTPWDSLDCSPPGSSVHEVLRGMGCHFLLQGIFPTWGSSQCGDWTPVSCVGRQILYHWPSWTAPCCGHGHH